MCPEKPNPIERKLKVGVALGGGGAKGLAHIGVLKVLKKHGIPVDIITGTSIGAIVAAVYAAGNLEKLETVADSIKLTEIPRLLSPSWSLGGVFSGSNALDVLLELAGCKNIEELKIPYGSVSANLDTGDIEYFTSGDLSTALKASFAIPGIFTPLTVGEKLLVDGGTVEPVPVELTKSLGADIVIAVELFGNEDESIVESLETKEEKRLWPAGVKSATQYLKGVLEKVPLAEKLQGPTALEILEKTLVISQRTLTNLRLKEHPPEITISPSVSHVGILDFHRGDPVVKIGEIAAEDSIEKIKELLEQH